MNAVQHEFLIGQSFARIVIWMTVPSKFWGPEISVTLSIPVPSLMGMIPHSFITPSHSQSTLCDRKTPIKTAVSPSFLLDENSINEPRARTANPTMGRDHHYAMLRQPVSQAEDPSS